MTLTQFGNTHTPVLFLLTPVPPQTFCLTGLIILNNPFFIPQPLKFKQILGRCFLHKKIMMFSYDVARTPSVVFLISEKTLFISLSRKYICNPNLLPVD